MTSKNLTEKTSFLRAFVDWLAEWEHLKLKNCSGGLSKETFEAARHTSACLAELCEYLIEKRGFKYFAPGKSQSDPLEGKFGQYRQMTGGNMYASVRQFVESERTLRVKNLSKLQLSVAQVKEIFSSSKESKSQLNDKISSDIFSILEAEKKITRHFAMPDSDRNSIFYIAGCFAYQLSKHLSCIDCKLIFVDNQARVSILDESDGPINSDSEFLQLVNRGGLSIPTESVFDICSVAWMLYTRIMESDCLCKMLHSPNQSSRTIFSDVVLKFLESSDETAHFSQISCTKGQG